METSGRSPRSMTGITVRVAAGLDELEDYADAWDALALVAPEQLPMLSHAWVAAFLETALRPGETWRCLFAFQGDALVGVLPVVRSSHLAGSHLRGPRDSQTAFAHPLLAVSTAQDALRGLMDTLHDLDPGHSWVRFYGVRENSPVPAACRALGDGTVVTSPLRARGSLVPTTTSFETFESELPPNFRRNLRKGRNRARREHSMDAEFIAGPEAGRPKLLQEFLEVESSGWKASAGTAIACSPAQSRFYAALTRRLARRGWLEWQRLSLDGTVAAAHLAVRFGGALVLPKIGFDERFARLGPGNLLFREAAVRAFGDDSIQEINCLSDMSWHRNWQMPQSTYQDLLVRPRGLTSLVSGLRESAELWERSRALADRVPGLLPAIQRARKRYGV